MDCLMEVYILNDIALQDLIARYKDVNPKSVVGMETLSTQYYVDTLLKKIYNSFGVCFLLYKDIPFK